MSHPSTNVVAAQVRACLPRSAFEPARSRLLWMPVHLLLIVASVSGIVQSSSMPLRWLLALVVGASFGGLAFVAHEALHGALCRRRRLRKLVGFVGFLPFCLAPRLWVAWHNRVHHGNTNRLGVDPDAIATLSEYSASRAARWSSDLQRSSRGLFTLFFGFSVQSAQVLATARRRGYLPGRHHNKAILESLVGVGTWTALGAFIGLEAFWFAYVLPLMIANAIVMAHIVTNHGLRPADEHNDPLSSSTTVTVPRLVSFWTLDFGYHTEHHLFPAMSHRHGAKVSRILAEMFPRRYHRLPLATALLRVCQRPRVFLDDTTLIDPRTGVTAEQFVGLTGPSNAVGPAPGEEEVDGAGFTMAASARALPMPLPPPSAARSSSSRPAAN